MRKTLAILFVGSCCLTAQEVFTGPMGFNKVTCLSNSDTIVGVPFRAQGSLNTTLASAPVGATLTLSVTNLAANTMGLSNGYPTHYVKFNDGTAKEGSFYTITANTTNSVTIDLNGDNLTGTTTGDSLLIAKYWTLDSLFPPADATTTWTETPASSGNWVPNGNAIVASANALVRKTEIQAPNYTGQGTNLSTNATYFITGGVWKKFGSLSELNIGQIVMYPDQYIVIRHNASVTRSTIFKSMGDVEVGKIAIPLSTRTGGKQDNFVALSRPVAVSLVGLGLSEQAFINSPNALSRKDEMLVFDNEIAAKNKSASATYYRLATGWRKFGDGTVSHDNTTIPAGSGFLIRKAATATGASTMWLNPPTY